MAEHKECGAVRFGATTIEYTVRRSRRRKKTIQISLDHGAGVLVAAPLKTSPERIRQVVLRRAGWIVRKGTEAALHPLRKEFAGGESLLYLGCEAPLLVERAHVRRPTVELEDGSFRIAVPTGLAGEERRVAVESVVVRWYRARAAEHLRERVERWSEAIGLVPTQVLVRNQRRRWGSCSPDGKLRFNWRIVMAAPALVDYLVVHELLHLRVRNHSPVFWAEMARVMPDYKARRSALKETEPALRI